MDMTVKGSFRSRKQLVLDDIVASGASTRSVKRQLRDLSHVADDVLRQLWQQAHFSSSLSLLAVGGYGRGELFPHSDIDVLILLPEGMNAEADEAFKNSASNFITSCWDAGLEIGSSVRTLSEALSDAHIDVTIQTSLLESRLLAGAAKLHSQFAKAYRQALNPQAFFTAKTLEAQQRHTKFEDTP